VFHAVMVYGPAPGARRLSSGLLPDTKYEEKDKENFKCALFTCRNLLTGLYPRKHARI
jgi:hypothetical protein